MYTLLLSESVVELCSSRGEGEVLYSERYVDNSSNNFAFDSISLSILVLLLSALVEVIVVEKRVLAVVAVVDEVRSIAHWTKPNNASKSGFAASLVPGVNALACFNSVAITRPTGAVR